MTRKSEPARYISSVEKINQRRAQTLASIASEAIREMIIEGELRSGDRINESHLADRLGISRGPVREACRSLEQAGLLYSTTNKGAFVRELSEEEARYLYELRGALTGLAGRLIVQRGTDAAIGDLRKRVEKMDRAVKNDDAAGYFKLNLEFHDALIKAAQNPALESRYREIVDQLHLMRRRGLVDAHNIQVSNEEHQNILDALEARDPDLAERRMREHVEGGFSRLKQSLHTA
ncbi:GntR family transcriptional regulator [Thioclava nitratireducens]|uniref:GntR family transcriptional regulator n=1 Tax=Thioclava nitratireducens TaxID=1915078 RepID=UPI002480AED9|nr:GntR family transcriptional regulator [Thioclava nitratireducens]WGT52595.1 GntR family transcriptional regulator [Thioclava nitratireducens]